MAYFLVHSDFTVSAQTVEAGTTALGVWLRVGTWCARHNQTFEISPAHLRHFRTTRRTVQRLVDVGLWETTARGYRFVPNPRLWSFEPDRTGRPAIPSALRRDVLDRDGHVCLFCGATEDLQMDHVYPWSLGGPTTYDNLQTLCGPCNRLKGASV